MGVESEGEWILLVLARAVDFAVVVFKTCLGPTKPLISAVIAVESATDTHFHTSSLIRGSSS